MSWLIAEGTAREMQVRLEAGIGPTDARAEEFAAENAAEAAAVAQDGRPRILTVAGDVAEIAVDGILTNKRDFFAWLFDLGNTTYSDIRASLAIADADPAVKRILFNVHSPGGQVDGLFDTLAAIQDTKKPKSVRTGYAASAAYGIAATAGRITATNAAVEVGSIGVAQSFFVSEDVVDITSTKAPKKRPDVTTEQGKADVREVLDALHDLFAEAIASGRGTTVADVDANFGQGAVLVAGDAKKRGMIDTIERSLRAVPRRSSSTAEETPPEEAPVVAAADEQKTDPVPADGDITETGSMDIKTLEKDHPEVFAAVCDQAVTAERDRVGAHLTMGEKSGDMKTAIAAIKSGDEMTQTLTATYLSAGMNRSDIAASEEDDAAAAAATENLEASAEEGDLGDQIVALRKAARGEGAQ